ncbi:hypothetical protein Tco_1094718 [Tanacetum coccineum]|uniref:Uncharacterized protein n=1 Tax=Tanacetum coccineum TaxID=301880 RepID=A0ABQ5IGA7_9ASTR
MCTYLKKWKVPSSRILKFKEFDYIQEMFDRAFKRVNTFEYFRTKLVEGKEKRAGVELIQENAKKQKMENDKETAEVKQYLEITLDEKEVTINAIPLAIKSSSISYDIDGDLTIAHGSQGGTLLRNVCDEISLGGEKLQESDIDGGTIAGKAIITWDGEVTSYGLEDEMFPGEGWQIVQNVRLTG